MKQSLSSGGTAGPGPKSTLNQRAALVSAYNELGKELASTKLKTVGNYTLGRTIGEGTFGKVRMGTHRLLGTRVAIKQVPKAHSASLTREIHHHRRLHHFHVMKLYEVLATESNIWMISELCLGGELYDYLVERGTLSEAEARRIFGQLCLAVAYVHGQGIVHRDLKLENVLLDERCNVKLGDFGFTREFEGKRLMETFCGTTGYAAPEMLAGKKYTGEEVDIWSLGIILYALLYGSLPFDDDDEAVMKGKILLGEFELPDVVSDEARDLITSILRLDPTQRPSVKAILSHPWFTKIFISTPMSTVDEHGDADYFGSPAVGDAHPSGVGDEATMPSVSQHGLVGVGQHGLGVDLGAPADRPSSVSQDGSSQVSNVSSKPSDEEGMLSERRSKESVSTGATSIDGSLLPGATSGDDTIQADSQMALPKAVSGRPPIGMQHHNESQTTIRKGCSTDSTKPSAVAAPAAASGLSTHHESPVQSDDTAALSAPTSPTIHMRKQNRQLTEGVTLVKRDSQSSSKGHHRTPSRTKRRSLSSSGLSDHHPPHLANKPVDFCSMLQQQQPALFSTDLEQNLLYQLGNLGMDVGQMVHSILTDACDASAATWWILRQKASARSDVSVGAGLSKPQSTTPVVSAASLPPAFAAPPLPPKDPTRNLSGSPASAGATSSTKKTDGLPLAHEDSLRRQLQSVQPRNTEPQKPSKEKSPQSLREKVRGTQAQSSGPSAIVSPKSPAIPLSVDARSLVGSPRLEPGSPQSQTDSMMSEGIGKAARPRPSRDRTNSLSLKLASVLGGRKEGGTVPEVPKVSTEEDGSRTTGNSNGNGKGMSSLFLRRPTGGAVPPKASREGLQGDRAVSQPLLNRATDSADAPAHTIASPTTDDGRTAFGVSPIPPSPSKSLATGSLAQQRAVSSGETTHGSIGLSSSQSVDTFSTISSNRSEDQGVSNETSYHDVAGKSRNKSTSFMTTVRTWLGTEDKQSRRKGKKKTATGERMSLGPVPDIDTGSPTLYRKRSRSGQHNAGPGASSTLASRRHPRSGASRSPSVHRQSNSGALQPLSLADTHPTSFSRPSPLRRPSAGSITPTGLYGSTPSRAPSASSLYRNAVTSPSGLHGRAPSVGSMHSGLRGSSLQHHSLVGGHAGAASSSGLGSSSGSIRGLGGRRMSSDGGTIVIRQRVHHRPRSESSRPTSLIDTGDTGLAVASDPDESLSAPLTAGFSEPASGAATPRRTSVDSRRDADSTHGRAASAHPHSVFVAHRNRHSYKPPSANPALFARRSQRDVSGDVVSPPRGPGAWRKSWGQPPSVWRGSVDHGSPRSEIKNPLVAHDRGSTSAPSDAVDRQPKLRDVFSSKRGGLQDDEWEDEDDGPVFSGGLGQLDSNGTASAASRSLDLPTMAGSSTSPLFGQSSPVLGGSGRGHQKGAMEPSTWSYTSRKDSGVAPALFTSRYAGVRSAFFQPPALGRDIAPRTIIITEGEGSAKAADTAEGTSVAISGRDKASASARPEAAEPDSASSATAEARPSASTPGPASRIRGSAIAPTFHAVEEEDEGEEE
ncbi:unnamed protein product [Parajaminaea phylloscopi]